MLFRTGLYVKDHQVEKVQVASTPIANYNGNVTGLYIPEIVAMINAIQASGTPAPDNVLPIYGRNGVLVNRYGSNWWDEQWEVGSIDPANGAPSTATNVIRSKNYINIKQSNAYYCTNGNVYAFYQYDADKNYIGEKLNTNTISFASGTVYVKFRTKAVYGTTYNNDISVNYPSTDTEYHAFVGNPYTKYFEGLLNGTYGFVDMGTLNWTYYTSSGGYFSASVSGKAFGITNIITKAYLTSSEVSVSSMPDKTIKGTPNNNAIFVKDSDFTDATAFTNAMRGVYLIYEKATVSSPTITQAQADTLLTAFDVDDKSVIIVFDQTVYGGYVNVETGVLTITHANIASYNGESINEPWLSSMDEYSSGATPTTGAQVVYPLTTPITVQLTPKQLEQLLMNNVFADTGNVAVKFYNVIR